MKSRMLLIPALGLVAIALAGCSSKSTTSPAYGAGPGGTPSGPTFNLTFPAQNVSQSFTFGAGDTGSWAYHCAAHQNMGMTGTVVVNAAGTDSALVVVGVPSFTFNPATVTIKPGGHVRWVNQSTLVNHTVTRP